MKKRLTIVVTLFLLLAFTMQALAFATVPLKSIKLSSSAISLKVAQSYVLKATLNPSNTTQKVITYTTSNAKVASVDKNGKVVGVAAGKAVIAVVSSLNKKILAKCNVTVISELKKVTLKFLSFGPGKQQDSDKVWSEFNNKLSSYLPNTKVNFEVLSAAQYKEKWQLMIAAGEQMDIAWTGWLIPYVEEITKGAYKPLDELLDKYGAGIRKELPSWILEKARVYGKIYSIPCYQMMSSVRVAIKTHKKLADKYLDIEKATKVFNSSPYMTKEKYDIIEGYLKTLKDNNELRKGISPHSYTQLYYAGYEQIVGPAYINPHGKDPTKVLSQYDIPEDKLMTDTYHDWFNKGYIRKDVIGTTLNDLRKDEGKEDGYVVWEAGIAFEQDKSDSIRYGFDVKNIPVFNYYYLPNSQSATSLAIPRTSQNPERAMMLLELLNTKKGDALYNLLAYGIEGDHYKKISNSRIETIANSKYGIQKWALGNTFNAWLTQTETDGINEYIQTEMHDKAFKSPIMGFKVNTNPIKNELAQIAAVGTEFAYIQWLPNYEDKYKEMVAKIKNAGLDKVINEVQKQLTQWVKDNKK